MVDINGNATGGTPTVPDTPIETGGLGVNEIAQIEAAKQRAYAEQATAAAVAVPVLAEYDKDGHA